VAVICACVEEAEIEEGFRYICANSCLTVQAGPDPMSLISGKAPIPNIQTGGQTSISI
jgi:hypothetical protein